MCFLSSSWEPFSNIYVVGSLEAGLEPIGWRRRRSKFWRQESSLCSVRWECDSLSPLPLVASLMALELWQNTPSEEHTALLPAPSDFRPHGGPHIFVGAFSLPFCDTWLCLHSFKRWLLNALCHQCVSPAGAAPFSGFMQRLSHCAV